MPSLEKTIMLREFSKRVEKKPYLFFAKFTKLSTSDLGDLRRNLSKSADTCTVVKNTIARKTFEQLGIKGIEDLINGQTLLATCKDEPQRVSKVLVDFSKDRDDRFKISGAYVDGAVFEAGHVKQLAALPSKHELLTKVACGVKSPITNFVLTLNAVIRSFVVVLGEVSRKKSSAS